MDLLFQRYASPFLFINGMIQTGRFSDFVDSFVETTNKEKDEEAMWEVYLHKVFDKSYAEFKEQIQVDRDNASMSDSDIETTIKNSMNILGNFNPEQ